MPKPLKWIIAVVVAAALLGTVGTYVYIHFIEDDAPPPLSIDAPASSGVTTTTASGSDGTTSTTAGAPAGEAGTWNVVSNGTQVGYRVKEVLFGQDTEAVGRTSNVTGTLALEGTTVKSVDLTVDMTTVKSDKDQRDGQFKGRIMSTGTYPTATFTLTKPITLDQLPGATPVTVKATGDLQLHGTTKSVVIDLLVKRVGGTVTVNGSIPITFADYGIPNPTFGPVSTEDHGTLELLVNFTPA